MALALKSMGSRSGSALAINASNDVGPAPRSSIFQPTRRTLVIVVCIVAVLAVALGVGLGVGLDAAKAQRAKQPSGNCPTLEALEKEAARSGYMATINGTIRSIATVYLHGLDVGSPVAPDILAANASLQTLEKYVIEFGTSSGYETVLVEAMNSEVREQLPRFVGKRASVKGFPSACSIQVYSITIWSNGTSGTGNGTGNDSSTPGTNPGNVRLAKSVFLFFNFQDDRRAPLDPQTGRDRVMTKHPQGLAHSLRTNSFDQFRLVGRNGSGTLPDTLGWVTIPMNGNGEFRLW